MSHDTLKNLYDTIFSLAHHYKYNIHDIENLLAYELDIFVDMIKVENERQQDTNQLTG